MLLIIDAFPNINVVIRITCKQSIGEKKTDFVGAQITFFIFYFYYSYIVWRRAREPILPASGYTY
jgi:hypothetical protein